MWDFSLIPTLSFSKVLLESRQRRNKIWMIFYFLVFVLQTLQFIYEVFFYLLFYIWAFSEQRHFLKHLGLTLCQQQQPQAWKNSCHQPHPTTPPVGGVTEMARCYWWQGSGKSPPPFTRPIFTTEMKPVKQPLPEPWGTGMPARTTPGCCRKARHGAARL